MYRFYMGFFAVFGFVYLTYMTWLTGYKAGYDEGTAKAWTNARKALAPELVEPAELTTAAAVPRQVRVPR